ncbi:Pseudouridine-5'-phosphate glycosidase [Carpediemonas membranifera]|uniref:Pseudouridine-5'-phosphate glycosidase n=1 Tax=Carpediemonas membranifera TaxID=201153 RepID=A0A8J6ARC4_9EUKA|nr:Pseudouridine-5'-phosphate glycosidase [Carpediemonas membranifera]|eukprot:KAG9389460.1 Pseudouridine-5'-phosphate glycosidase [Carpediemonas membranifera]
MDSDSVTRKRSDSVASSVNEESIENTLRSGRRFYSGIARLLSDSTTIGLTVMAIGLAVFILYSWQWKGRGVSNFMRPASDELQLDKAIGSTSFKLHYSPEVRRAIKKGLPIVALESTIISHGMPYPQNVATARRLEAIIREEGAVPATIAILNGKVRVGLTDEQLETLANGQEPVSKVSRRDMGLVMATRGHGATTVAATMLVAAKANIKVFATGGIGGVHYETPGDVSADLDEFTKSPVTVVSAGVKAILDVPQTLEVLETKGIPVIAFNTTMFPCFYSRECYGLKAPITLDSPRTIAAVISTQRDVSVNHGVLVANPVEADDEFPFDHMEQVIKDVRAEAIAAGVLGKDITPYFLRRIAEITEGKSLETNIALVMSNARLAAQIARYL